MQASQSSQPENFVYSLKMCKSKYNLPKDENEIDIENLNENGIGSDNGN